MLFGHNLGEYESAYDVEFTLTDMADLQEVLERAVDQEDSRTSEHSEDVGPAEAMGITFDLITLRMLELIIAAHRQVASRGHRVGGVRIFSLSHDSQDLPLCCPARRAGGRQ